MATRTTAAAVEKLIEIDEDIIVVDADLDPFIETASMLVTDVALPASITEANPAGYSSAKLELIERWLSAHFYAIRDPRRFSESVGPAREVFQFKLGLGLDVTTYGQQVKFLDTAGGLSALDVAAKAGTLLKRRIGVYWLGKEDEVEDIS